MQIKAQKVMRYVAPLREGGSLPAIVEADDDGMYVLKFRGAGQGPKALVAEFLAAGLGRLLGLPIPEVALLELDPALARTEPDPEIQDLIRASGGLNLGLDYLPGAINFDPNGWQPDPELAAKIVWFDAFIMNVDRTAKNTNLLVWHDQLWLIDHGAGFYFHHSWETAAAKGTDPFKAVQQHVLLPFAGKVPADWSANLNGANLGALVAAIPDSWLEAEAGFGDTGALREAYGQILASRLEHQNVFWEEACRVQGPL